MLERLDPEVFVRVHRSAIGNVRHIMHIEAAGQGDYVLTLDHG
jgi:DNA-binding LytR/AlgR family response regulator